MQSSSLIFVIVVAIWAVYLLQYWIKRRDHLSTVRSVDRFSAAMRVLDHHRLHDEGAEPAPRSYAITPTKAARPTVTVKRAAAPRTARDAGAHDGVHETRDAGAPDHESPVQPMTSTQPAARRTLIDRVVDAPRRVRGLTLLAHLALLPVVLLLTAFGPLPWWLPVVMLVGTAGAFGWLRQGVVEERAAARAHARAVRHHADTGAPERARTAPAATRTAAARPAATRSSAPRTSAPRTSTAAAPTAEATVRRERADAPFDAQPSADLPQAEAPTAEVVEPVEARTEPEPGTWQPVPVPRPTYTMKARVQRPEPAPLPTEQPRQAMAPVEDDLEELPAVDGDLVAPRRVVGG